MTARRPIAAAEVEKLALYLDAYNVFKSLLMLLGFAGGDSD